MLQLVHAELNQTHFQALLVRLLDRAIGPKVREFAALAIVNACSGKAQSKSLWAKWHDEATVRVL